MEANGIMNNNYIINSIFPLPVYIAKRDSDLDTTEKKEIEDIIEEGMERNLGNSNSVNPYIFNGKLKKIKQFCEQQIKNYVEKIINPEEKLDFYITQSWLNITKPGEWHHEHCHSNSIISGVFYISTVENDKITFSDPNFKIKQVINIIPKKPLNVWNTSACACPAKNNELVLFPSWLNHDVPLNEKATTDRISISFNTFVKGTLGKADHLSELILS